LKRELEKERQIGGRRRKGPGKAYEEHWDMKPNEIKALYPNGAF
jgi:hypothetical protein